MATQLLLSRQQLADLSAICELSPDELRAVRDRVTSITATLLRPAQLRSPIRDVVAGDERIADSIVRQVLGAAGLIRQRRLNSEQVIEGLTFGLRSASSWAEADLARWQSIAPSFQELIELRQVRTLAKAVELSYEYANLFQSARIVTDIRPIFDDSASDIEGAVISYTLRLRFDNLDGNHSLSIALDESDVKNLMEQCVRAVEKAKTAHRCMAQRAGVATIISGKEENADAP